MTWFGWFLILFTLLGIAVSIANVGKPRKPLDAGTAAWVFVVQGLLVVGILLVGTGSL